MMAGVHAFEYLVTAPMHDVMLAADSAANKLLAEEAQEKAQATAKKGKKKKKIPKKLCQVASAAHSFCLLSACVGVVCRGCCLLHQQSLDCQQESQASSCVAGKWACLNGNIPLLKGSS